MSVKAINIVHLYPEDMNIYGDSGNVIVLANRLKWRDIPFKIVKVNQGDAIPPGTDIIIGGGGQDIGQRRVEADLQKKSTTLKSMSDDGVVMLMICGLYQLFGDSFITKDKVTIKGIGILPVHTEASDSRMIGNIAIETEFGRVVGYENHSGKTWLHEGANPFGKVTKGFGNNGEDHYEGARVNNIYASYLHGPILSKNPKLADGLIGLALKNRGISLAKLDDSLEEKAAEMAFNRP